MKEWKQILKKIDRAFDVYYKTEIKYNVNRTPKKITRDWEIIKEGIDLFGKWFLYFCN
jgi:hypothetical protein